METASLRHGYRGYFSDKRVSTQVKSLEIWIRMDEKNRFLEARVVPYRQVGPFH
jgi:hypothetical protein